MGRFFYSSWPQLRTFVPMEFPDKLSARLDSRAADLSLRQLGRTTLAADFSSNDYLGFANSAHLFALASNLLTQKAIQSNGATGSRLLTGNHLLYEETERVIAQFHQSESALIFNSGYDANVGVLSCVPQRSDVILYDELCHASIRDGIRLSTAASYKFRHNDMEHLRDLTTFVKQKQPDALIYIVTESVFSMDGDSPDLNDLTDHCQQFSCLLILDEAHALGVFGERGEGLAQILNIPDKVFARIVTFGKGLGCHGAAVLGQHKLREYLTNYARSFIYTTGLPPHAVATVASAYGLLNEGAPEIGLLKENIIWFNQQKSLLGIKQLFVRSKSAIHSAIIPGNDKVKDIAAGLQRLGYDVRPILSPTVPQGQERLRFCLHSYNSKEEITAVLQALQTLLADGQ